MRLKTFTFACLAVALIASGCQRGPAPLIDAGRQADAASAQGLSANDSAELAAIAEQLAARYYADDTADPRWEGASSRLIGPRGGLLYRMLAGSKLLRKAGYKVAEGPVLKHFSKPSQEDKVAPLGQKERKELQALLRPGDLIQCGNNGSFVHVIFYVGNDVIIHALAQSGFGKKMIGVREETLSAYLDRVDRDTFVVLRPRWTPEQLDKAVEIARGQVGRDYDTLFMTDSDDRLYCTELAYHLLTQTGVARVEPHLAGKVKWRLITNEDLRRSPDLEVVYRRNHD